MPLPGNELPCVWGLQYLEHLATLYFSSAGNIQFPLGTVAWFPPPLPGASELLRDLGRSGGLRFESEVSNEAQEDRSGFRKHCKAWSIVAQSCVVFLVLDISKELWG